MKTEWLLDQRTRNNQKQNKDGKLDLETMNKKGTFT